MKHNYLDNIPLEEAKERFFSLIKEDFSHSFEEIATTDAVGRILKNAVYAKICCPHYNASALCRNAWRGFCISVFRFHLGL